MSVQILLSIGIGVFVILAFVLSGSATLENLSPIPGENVLFEEAKVRVEQKGSPRSAVFFNCLIRVTDYRIIIAQKNMLGRSHSLRHVITYNNRHQNTEAKAGLKAYLEWTMDPAAIQITEEGVSIGLPDSGLTKGQTVLFSVRAMPEFRKIIKG